MGLQNNKPYYYKVLAEDLNLLSSPLAGPVRVVPYPGPSAPMTLAASGIEGGVSLAWGSSYQVLNPVGGYDVFRKTGTAPFIPIARIPSADAASYIDDTAEEGVSYTYKVRAWDSTLRRGEPSNEASAAAIQEKDWRHIQRSVVHSGNATSEAFNLPITSKWLATAAGINLGVVIKGTMVFQGTASGVTALDLSSGKTMWTQVESSLLAGSVIKWPAVQDGSVYYTNGSSLVALDGVCNPAVQKTTEKWRYQLGIVSGNITGIYPVRVGPTVGGGVAYIGMGGKVFAIDAETGVRRWTDTLTGSISSDLVFPPVISGDSIIFLTTAGRLYSFGAGEYNPILKQGKMRYQASLGITGLTGAPTLAGNLLVIPARTGMLGINPNNGKAVWSYSVTGVIFASEPAYSSGTVFAVSGNDGALRAFNASSGQPLWTFSVTGFKNTASGSAPVIAGGVVYYSVNLTPAKGGVEGRLIGVTIPGGSGVPTLAFKSAEDIKQTNVSPSIARRTIVLGNMAFGGQEGVSLALVAPGPG